MGGNKMQLLLSSDVSIKLIDNCFVRAQEELPKLFASGEKIRKFHTNGQKNFSTRASAEGSLRTSREIVNTIIAKKQRSKKTHVKLFGENITEALNVLKYYFSK